MEATIDTWNNGLKIILMSAQYILVRVLRACFDIFVDFIVSFVVIIKFIKESDVNKNPQVSCF